MGDLGGLGDCKIWEGWEIKEIRIFERLGTFRRFERIGRFGKIWGYL